MRYCIISIYSFPNGLAATNRIIAYSKGLLFNGVSIDVLITHPTDNYNNTEKLKKKGTFEGINFKYVTQRYKNKYKIIRALLHLSGLRSFIGFLFTAIEIIKNNRKKPYDSILVSNDSIFFVFFYTIISKLIKVKLIFIFDEFPKPIRHKLKNKIPIIKKYSYIIILRWVDGYVSISNKLMHFYNDLYSKPTFILPMIIDTSRFDNISYKFNNPSEGYICYMGNMELSKDNVNIIIVAFSKISDSHPKINLHLYGQPTIQNLNYLNKLVKDLNLSDRVFFKGIVPNSEVPNILQQALILVSSQPETVRASGGFPTKLGEYLASGIPTLITNVGENSKYVKDDIHLYFSTPNDFEMYASKLNYILNNYDQAKHVANNGKKFIELNYSYKQVGKKMKDFINNLNN